MPPIKIGNATCTGDGADVRFGQFSIKNGQAYKNGERLIKHPDLGKLRRYEPLTEWGTATMAAVDDGQYVLLEDVPHLLQGT